MPKIRLVDVYNVLSMTLNEDTCVNVTFSECALSSGTERDPGRRSHSLSSQNTQGDMENLVVLSEAPGRLEDPADCQLTVRPLQHLYSKSCLVRPVYAEHPAFQLLRDYQGDLVMKYFENKGEDNLVHLYMSIYLKSTVCQLGKEI